MNEKKVFTVGKHMLHLFRIWFDAVITISSGSSEMCMKEQCFTKFLSITYGEAVERRYKIVNFDFRYQ